MGVRRVFWGALLGAALMLIAPAGAVASFPTDVPVATSGALIYSWHGDPARGCARAGACGTQGTLVVQMQGPSDVTLFAPRSGAVDFSAAASTVRVRRTEVSSQGDCIDQSAWPNNSSGGPVAIRWGTDGRARLVIPADGPSSGRCAGPLPGDLPSVVPGRRLAARGLRFAFLATRPWAAGPFSGTLVSTVRISPAVYSGSTSGSIPVSEPSSSPGPGPRLVFDERVRVTYRVSAAPGTVTVNLRGESDPFCGALDSCGTTGAVSVAFAGHQGIMSLEGDRVVTRRIGASRALADFRAGRLSFGLPDSGLMRTFTVSETLARPGGATCTDALGAPTQSITWLGTPFGGPPPNTRVRSVPVIVETMSFSDEFLRTHCPGPLGTDVFGDNQVMAIGQIGLHQLLAAHSRVVLAPPAAFSAPGYAGRFSGTLGLRLSVVKVVAGTVRVPQ